MNTTLDKQALVTQHKDLTIIHQEILDHIQSLEKYVDTISFEVAQDFDRICKANKKLKSLLENLHDAKPHANENTFAFWSKKRHDLRTPINGIKNYSEMIIEELEETENAFLILPFSKIIQSAEKTLRIIDNIGRNVNAPGKEDYIQPSTEDDQAWYVIEGGTVLIIDDNQDNREVLRQRLQKAGLIILEAEDGFEGMKKVEDNDIDLILLDIMMPRLNGYEVLDRLKAKEEFSYIPVLMITSVTELSSIVRCIEAGADDYLPTPFNPVILRARISACLEKKRHADREKTFMKKLETAQRQLEAGIESIKEGFAIFDDQDRLVKYNEPFKNMYPDLFTLESEYISYDTFLRENLANGTFSPDRRLNESPKDWLNRHKLWHETPTASLLERVIPLNIWVEIQEYKTLDGGTVSIHKDITKRKEEEDRLSQLALYDSLTNLANRSLFEKTLQEVFKASEESDTFFSILYIDLDGFKNVNDTLGHEFGDKILVSVAERIQNCIRSKDLAARLGGDEFAVLLPKSQDIQTTKLIAERIIEDIGSTVTHEGDTAQFGVSIGIAGFPNDGKTPDELLKAADTAMYAAKKAGKGQYKTYEDILKAS